MRSRSTSTHSATPSFIVTASGCAPPMPPRPGGERDRAGERAAEAAPRDLGEALVGALHDALGADVDPRAGGHLAVHRQAERLEPAELVPGRPLAARGSSWRSAPAAPTRACGTRRPACPTGRASSRRRRASAACAPGRRTPPRSAPPCPVPPYTTRSSGRSATSGSRLFISIRSAASCGQPRQESSAPRGACTARATLTRGSRSRPRPPRAPRPTATSASTSASSGASQRSGPGPGTTAAHRGARGRRARARLERRAQVERSRGAGELHREDAAQVRDHGAQLARRAPAHRHVVLLHRARGQRVGARGHGQPAVLGHHRRLRVVGEHHPRVHARRPR